MYKNLRNNDTMHLIFLVPKIKVFRIRLNIYEIKTKD